jgi:tetratricopeptide (TPR) repeat protein
MGEAASAYRLEEYPTAIQLFTQAVLDADNDSQRARAVFNLANSYYQLQDYGMAANLYRETLRYAPKDQAAQLNLSFALTLQQQQEQSENEKSARQGRGSRSARPPGNTEVTEGTLSLHNEEEHTQPSAIPSLPDRPSSVMDIIELGIHESRPVVEQATVFRDPDWHYAASSQQRIAAQIDTLSNDESKLWQRLFEQEEGFPAALEAPRELPGTRPW